MFALTNDRAFRMQYDAFLIFIRTVFLNIILRINLFSGNAIMQTIENLAFHHKQTSLIQSTIVEALPQEFIIDTRHKSLISARLVHSTTPEVLIKPTMQQDEEGRQEDVDELTEDLDKVATLEAGRSPKGSSSLTFKYGITERQVGGL